MTGQAVGHHSGLPTAVGRPVLMGVVNVTPDSFSDGGYWFEPAAAIAHGRALAAEGADLVDGRRGSGLVVPPDGRVGLGEEGLRIGDRLDRGERIER